MNFFFKKRESERERARERADLKLTMIQKRECSGSVVKNPPANAGDMGSIPGLGRSHMPRSN